VGTFEHTTTPPATGIFRHQSNFSLAAAYHLSVGTFDNRNFQLQLNHHPNYNFNHSYNLTAAPRPTTAASTAQGADARLETMLWHGVHTQG
jgi:hypothetical protein